MKRAVVLLALLSCAAPEPRHVENAHWLTDSLLSGAQPEGDEAFRELASLGVKTLISVDGMRPDVDAARKHGMRYVHLPIGYDGVPHERAMELAKAIQELPGPIFIHCHHGKHRGPAAAVVACVVAGTMTNEQAVLSMKKLGTGPQYLGLWESARKAVPAAAGELKELKVDFREVSPIPPLTDAMVGLDAVLDRLQLCRDSGWKPPPGHPDVDPPHEALRAREIFTEILRTDDCRKRPEDFRNRMESAMETAERFQLLLDLLTHSKGSANAADDAFDLLKDRCAGCHRTYRNQARR